MVLLSLSTTRTCPLRWRWYGWLRTSPGALHMSAIGSKADMSSCIAHVHANSRVGLGFCRELMDSHTTSHSFDFSIPRPGAEV